MGNFGHIASGDHAAPGERPHGTQSFLFVSPRR